MSKTLIIADAEHGLADVAFALDVKPETATQWMPRVLTSKVTGVAPSTGRGRRRKFTRKAVARLATMRDVMAIGCSVADAQAVAWSVLDVLNVDALDLLVVWRNRGAAGPNINRSMITKGQNLPFFEIEAIADAPAGIPLMIIKIGEVVKETLKRLDSINT